MPKAGAPRFEVRLFLKRPIALTDNGWVNLYNNYIKNPIERKKDKYAH